MVWLSLQGFLTPLDMVGCQTHGPFLGNPEHVRNYTDRKRDRPPCTPSGVFLRVSGKAVGMTSKLQGMNTCSRGHMSDSLEISCMSGPKPCKPHMLSSSDLRGADTWPVWSLSTEWQGHILGPRVADLQGKR